MVHDRYNRPLAAGDRVTLEFDLVEIRERVTGAELTLAPVERDDDVGRRVMLVCDPSRTTKLTVSIEEMLAGFDVSRKRKPQCHSTEAPLNGSSAEKSSR
jgi:hypothetical protein